MPVAIGHVEALFRYPVKTMPGERPEVAQLGCHGVSGLFLILTHRRV